MDEYQSARAVAERFIDYQRRSSMEVRLRLGRGGFSEDVSDRVVAELESAGLLDDSKFSEDWVESRARNKRLGPARLAAELRSKGITREDTESALEQLDPESALVNALALARKRLGIPPPSPNPLPPGEGAIDPSLIPKLYDSYIPEEESVGPQAPSPGGRGLGEGDVPFDADKAPSPGGRGLGEGGVSFDADRAPSLGGMGLGEGDGTPCAPHPTPDQKRRLAAYLQRRGYNWEIIQQVFAELFQNTD